jgi:hypothetical protein
MICSSDKRKGWATLHTLGRHLNYEISLSAARQAKKGCAKLHTIGKPEKSAFFTVFLKNEGCATLHTLGKAEQSAFFVVFRPKVKAVQRCTPLGRQKPTFSLFFGQK